MKKGLLGGIGLAVAIIAGLICVAKCSVRVPAGYIAVEYKMNGGISKNVLTQGWHLISPTVKTSLYSVGIEQSYLTSEDKESMNGIYTTSVQKSTIDESPMAYKPPQEIIDNIKDTVEIVDIIKPIYNFKASE